MSLCLSLSIFALVSQKASFTEVPETEPRAADVDLAEIEADGGGDFRERHAPITLGEDGLGLLE